ncbi:MAG TPA: hypothetical protein VE826_12610 [Dongiaceae bacterium]|nr:hypothetical protein [Dongiaceae bacterium]
MANQQHDDAPEVRELEQALSAYRGGGGGAKGLAAADAGAGTAAPGAAAAGGINICAEWGKVKQIVTAGIGVLRILPFKWAKGLADALQQLASTLNALCP